VIKLFSVIIIILIVIIMTFISFKFEYIISFNRRFNKFFIDIVVLTDRYLTIYYYFNTLRILMLFPDYSRTKLKFYNAMETINEHFEIENKKYTSLLLSNIKDYDEVNKLFNILKGKKDEKYDEINKIICHKEILCEIFLNSDNNFLYSGVDFALKAIITEISKLYMDYKKIKNKDNIEEIKSSIIFSKDSQFINIGISLTYFFLYVEWQIFTSFEKDETSLNYSYIRMMNYLNLFSIVISILLFLFIVFFIFIYISRFSEPIKDAAYRINCSFFYIKKYSLISNGKFDSNFKKSDI